MKKIGYSFFVIAGSLITLIWVSACRPDDSELTPAKFPTNPDVFIDGFSAGLNYAAFGGSDVRAFDVDQEVTYNQTAASMVFAVPDFEDPAGAYAGGAYFTTVGRDLSGYDALTFYAKATKSATLDVIGLGNDLGESKYQVQIAGLDINTNWKKYYIPLPDPSKLVSERGMFFYSEGPEDGKGYTFWIDEVKFEKLGTLAHPQPGILEGQNRTERAENGNIFQISGLHETFNLPSGVNQRVELAPAYFSFSSSDESVATVDAVGKVTVLSKGTAVISASLGNLPAAGSLTIQSVGDPVLPKEAAPTPDEKPEDVISIYSNAYNDVPVDFYNGYWQFSTTQNDFIQVNGDDVIRYTNLNFVGIQFTAPTVDAAAMTHFHIDIWTPDNTASPAEFKVLLVDIGPNLAFGGGDDVSHELTFRSPVLSTEKWVSLDIPLSNFTGLTRKNHLAQIVLSGTLPNVFADNIYFYNKSTGPSAPLTAAPGPTVPSGNVISIFSDAYSNVSGTDFNPNWGQATQVSTVNIAGNNTLKYSGLNYQGTQLAANQDVSGMGFLHLDYWTSNSSALNLFLISPGPVETPYVLKVPTEGKWTSVDIPLSNFSPVDLKNVFQFKFDGNGDIYLDNIYFRK